MTHLMYAVFREADRPGRPTGLGPDGAAVAVVPDDDLAVAVSRAPADGLPPTLPRVKAYTQVIAALHAVSTVLPFRYGCLLGGRDEVRALLERRRSAFRAALERVRGCAEMGVRLLLSEDGAKAAPTPPPAEDRSSGKAYLLSRRRHYDRMDRGEERARAALERLRETFADDCVAFAEEETGGGVRGLASASFLVRRTEVDRFRKIFKRYQADSDAPALLSGPWPPYSFARLEPERPAGPRADYGARSIEALP